MLTPWIFIAAISCSAQPQTLADAQLEARAELRLQRMRHSATSIAGALAAAAPTAVDETEAASLRDRLKELRKTASPELAPALDRLDAFYAEIPRCPWAKEFAGPLADAGAEELRFAAANAVTPEEFLSSVDADLRLPADLQALVKEEGIPVSRWITFGVVKRFLYRYRLRKPKRYRKVNAAEIIAGKSNVEVGVELSGIARGGHRAKEDKDWCFFIDGVEVEIPPTVYLFRKIHLPLDGERVSVRGWTYFDNFHPDEVPRERPTLFEIHPVYEVKVLPSAAPAPGNPGLAR